MKISNILYTLSLIIAFSTLTIGEPNDEQHEDMVKQLNLNKTQVEKLHDFKKNERQTQHELRSQLRSKHQELEVEILKQNVDSNKVAVLKKDILRLRNQLFEHRMSSMEKMKTILDPDQLNRLKEIKSQRRKERFEKRENNEINDNKEQPERRDFNRRNRQ